MLPVTAVALPQPAGQEWVEHHTIRMAPGLVAGRDGAGDTVGTETAEQDLGSPRNMTSRSSEMESLPSDSPTAPAYPTPSETSIESPHELPPPESSGTPPHKLPNEISICKSVPQSHRRHTPSAVAGASLRKSGSA